MYEHLSAKLTSEVTENWHRNLLFWMSMLAYAAFQKKCSYSDRFTLESILEIKRVGNGNPFGTEQDNKRDNVA